MMSDAAAIRSRYRFSQTRRTVGSLSSARILTGIVQTTSRGRVGSPRRAAGRSREAGKRSLHQFELVAVAAEVVDAVVVERLPPWPAAVLEGYGEAPSGLSNGHRDHFLTIQSVADQPVVGLDERKRDLAFRKVGQHDDADGGR